MNPKQSVEAIMLLLKEAIATNKHNQTIHTNYAVMQLELILNYVEILNDQTKYTPEHYSDLLQIHIDYYENKQRKIIDIDQLLD